MKTLSQFLDENHIAVHNGVKLFPTTHAKQRELERHVPRENLLSIHKKVVDKIHTGEYTPKHGSSFMVFDKERKQTVVMDYRRDKYKPNDNKSHLFIVSAYPEGAKGNPRHGQEHLTTEENTL